MLQCKLRSQGIKTGCEEEEEEEDDDDDDSPQNN